MIDIDAELLDLDAGWREVLEAYQWAGETGAGGSGGPPSDDPGTSSEDDVERADPAMMVGLAELPEEDERDDWLPRLGSLDGFDDERLSSLHGRLIALGWLGFEVGDRTTGMRYRITREGQRVLDGLVPIPTLRVVAGVEGDEAESDAGELTPENPVDDLEPAEA